MKSLGNASKYFLYARKSTDDQVHQLLSIPAQIDELREFAVKEGLVIVDVFIESKTAKVPGRDIFNQMLDRVEKGEAQGILAWHPDRLARNAVDAGRIIYLLDRNILTDLKFPTFWFQNTPQGLFMLSIAFGQSKYYVDSLSENT
ncbi:MAG: Recombinase [Candidatus Roizmanbacteria bacterium GW2011_GWA2_35_19]|uniref:Recombinase n=1 Tax=Candidatus Roizmanbacteria bacterium GW2011_GWA2_35_19 TaxID=1618478 RepID=A0A0G0BNT5_9BACT|nr:MAG: Recombinase [Candidatus Roizmanbacteria bacterium GW2011_GWA2_35_19]